MSRSLHTSSRTLITSMIGFVLITAIIVAANIALSNVCLRLDITEERLYTLSDGTENVLAKLKRPIVIKFYYSSSLPQIHPGIRGFAHRVEDLLHEYELAGNGRIVIEKHDPKPDTDTEDWALDYGVPGQPIDQAGTAFYMGLVIQSGDSHATIPFLDPRREQLLEYDITRLVARLGDSRRPLVGIVSSLPLLGRRPSPYPMPGQPPDPGNPPWMAFASLSEEYDLFEVHPESTSINDEIDVLVVVHPIEADPQLLFAIDQFVLRGGELVVFMDPMCMTEAEMRPASSQPGALSDFETLLKAWGVTYASGNIVVDLDAPTVLRTRDGVKESPVCLSLYSENVDPTDVLTAGIESLVMPASGCFFAVSTNGISATPLVFSSTNSAPVSVETVNNAEDMDEVIRNFTPGGEKLCLALRLHGKLKTAFPDGRPKEASGTESLLPQLPSLGESETTSTVILFADADMLYDPFCIQELSGVLGVVSYQPINDNLSLFGNSVDQLVGGPDLVAVRSRGTIDRQFKVVREMREDAQEKWLKESFRLQERLREIQAQLDELQEEKTGDQLMLSPEERAARAMFRQELKDTRRELREVRKKLREDIEVLGLWIKAMNIGFVPMLIAIAGIALRICRRPRRYVAEE